MIPGTPDFARSIPPSGSIRIVRLQSLFYVTDIIEPVCDYEPIRLNPCIVSF